MSSPIAASARRPAAPTVRLPVRLPLRLPALLASFSLAVLLAACGGGDGPDGAATATATADDAELAGPIVESEDALPADEGVELAAAAAPYSVSVSRTRAVVFQGKRASVDVSIRRKAGFDGAVTVSLKGLPRGVKASAVTIPAGETRAQVVLRAAATAPHSLPTKASVRADDSLHLASTALVVTVRGKAGSVDTSFGSAGGGAGGVIVTPVALSEDYAKAMAVQADGKVLVAGSTSRPISGTDFALVRYSRDGKLDADFGTRGVVAYGIGPNGGSDEAQAVAVQADGKILVAGSADMGETREDFAIARFLPDGRIDRSFGRKGRATTAFTGDSGDRIRAIAIQPDGKIVAGGVTYNGPDHNLDFALVRYLPDGSLDRSFGDRGRVVTSALPGAVSDSINALTLQEVDGEICIVAVGGEGGFVIARYRSDGRLDTRFGQGGVVTDLFTQYIGAARGVLATPDGKIVVTGHIDHDVATVRLLTDGTPDASFNGNGRVITPLSTTNWDEATSVVRQSDGKLVVGGWVYKGASSNGQFAALRYLDDGRLDSSFADRGIALPAVSDENRSAAGRALVLQSDRRVPTVRALMAGERNASNNDFALLRFWL